MITRSKARDLIGAGALDPHGDELGTIDSIYVDGQTDTPELAAVRVDNQGSEGGLCLVPLVGAEVKDGDLQVAYARDLVHGAPAVGAAEKLSQEDLAKLYYHYGLDYTVTVTEQQTVHLDRSDREDAVGSVEERHDVQVQRDPAEHSSEADEARLRLPTLSEEEQTVEELRQLAAERGVAGCSRMNKRELLSVLRSLPRRQTEESGVGVGGARYEERSVDELRQLAARRGIEGRSQMNKAGLVAALLGSYTLDELRQLAAEWGVEGRSQMNKDELLAALRDDSGVAMAGFDDHGAEERESGVGVGGARYEERSVDELRQLAARRGIEGRSQMNKAGLVAALLGSYTLDELRQLAAEWGVEGRSQMNKDELLAALRDDSGVAMAGFDDHGAEERESGVGVGGARYEERSVDELRQLAARRGIEGRSQMNKAGLVAALLGSYTLDELRQLAAEWGVEGRSQMNKDELLAALRDDSGVAMAGFDDHGAEERESGVGVGSAGYANRPGRAGNGKSGVGAGAAGYANRAGRAGYWKAGVGAGAAGYGNRAGNGKSGVGVVGAGYANRPGDGGDGARSKESRAFSGSPGGDFSRAPLVLVVLIAVLLTAGLATVAVSAVDGDVAAPREDADRTQVGDDAADRDGTSNAGGNADRDATQDPQGTQEQEVTQDRDGSLDQDATQDSSPDRDVAQGPDSTTEGPDGAAGPDLSPQGDQRPGPTASDGEAPAPGGEHPAPDARRDAAADAAPSQDDPTDPDEIEPAPGGPLPATGGGALTLLVAAVMIAGGLMARAHRGPADAARGGRRQG